MTISTKNTIVKISLFVITTILTAVTIKYQYSGVISDDGDSVADRWPYIKMAIQVSLLTFFVGIALGLLKRVRDLEQSDEKLRADSLTIMFFFSISGVFILYYPGLEQLGLGSDPNIFSVLTTFNTIQTIFFYLILKKTLKEKIALTTYAILLLMAITIIFISPFFTGGGNRYVDY